MPVNKNDYQCGNCGKELNHNIINKLAYDGSADWMGSEIDRINDYYKDKV